MSEVKDHNDGAPIAGLVDVDSSSSEEMAAFDALGPQTRAVLNNGMCVAWSSVETLKMIKTQWKANPLDKMIDERMAKMLRQANAQVALQVMIAKPRPAIS